MHTPRLHSLGRGTAALALLFSFGAATPVVSAQTMEFFGDWIAPASIELTVSPTPGAGQFPTITAALASVQAQIGTVPITVNVTGSASYSAGQGEAFPIQIPAYGVCIEGFEVVAGALPDLNGAGSGAATLISINSLGNPDLPRSVIRGLQIRADSVVPGSIGVQINVPLGGAAAPQLVAPEVRDCVVTGGGSIGIDIVGTNPGVQLAPVIERNIVRWTQGKQATPVAGIRVTGGTSPCSPVVRSNEIDHYATNVLLTGGGLTHQTRLQSNFVELGGINVDIVGCAPWVVHNTIAFAEPSAPTPIGIRWDAGTTAMTLTHNLIWNPAISAAGVNPADVVGPLGIFTNATRAADLNYDEDDTLTALNGGLFNNFGPVLFGGITPMFVGGDAFPVANNSDLHLSDLSILREFTGTDEVSPAPIAFAGSFSVPGAPAPMVVRRDHAHDIDFDARVNGQGVDMGADEVTLFDGAFIRGATIAPQTNSLVGIDMDSLGNLRPSPQNTWTTQVVVTGQPGDVVFVFSGVGFLDTVSSPAFPGVDIENRSVFQNLIGSSMFIPGVQSLFTFSLDLTGSVGLPMAIVDAGGTAVVTVNFGTAQPAFAEAEGHLQALVLDAATLTFVQSTNRLPIELNL